MMLDSNGIFALFVLGGFAVIVLIFVLRDRTPAGDTEYIKPTAYAADDCTLVVYGHVTTLQSKMHRVYSGGGVWTRTGSHEWTFKMNQPEARYIAEAINRDEGEL